MAVASCRLLQTSRLFERALPTRVAGAVSRLHTSLACGQQQESCRQTLSGVPAVFSQGCYKGQAVSSFLIPHRHATWYTDKRISLNLGAVGVGNVDPDVTSVSDEAEGQELVHMVNTSVEKADHGRLFAVISISGVQRKITVEDILCVETDFAPTVGDRIRLEKVLMVGGKDFTLIGQPLLSREQANVEATVIEKTLSHNRIWSTYKRRKRFRRLKLFRDPHTMIVINKIELNSIPEQ